MLARLLLLTLLASIGASAQDAELATLVFLNLPEGSMVEVDGDAVDLERDARLGQVHRRAAGRVRVQVRLLDGSSGRVQAELEVGAVTTIQYRDDIETIQVSPLNGVVAVAAPGVPQLVGGRALVGGAVLIGLAASAGGMVWAGGQMEDARVRADAAAIVYQQASTEADVVSAREAHDQAITDAEGARTWRLAAAGVGAVVYLAAVVDAFRHHSGHLSSGGLTASAPRRPIVVVRPVGLGASLTVRL